MLDKRMRCDEVLKCFQRDLVRSDMLMLKSPQAIECFLVNIMDSILSQTSWTDWDGEAGGW